MKKTDTLVFASVVAAAMIFGGVLGATFLAKSTLTNVNAAQSAASPSRPRMRRPHTKPENRCTGSG